MGCHGATLVIQLRERERERTLVIQLREREREIIDLCWDAIPRTNELDSLIRAWTQYFMVFYTSRVVVRFYNYSPAVKKTRM